MSAPTRAPADFSEWQRRYLALHSAVERVAAARRRRATSICVHAGLGELAALHNALVGERRGTPWRGVNYTLAHQAAALVARAGDGFAVLKCWGERYPLRALARAAPAGEASSKTPSRNGAP